MARIEPNHSMNTYRYTASVDEPNEAEREALKKFRQRLQDVLDGTESDYFLLRWLVARRFNLDNAEKMLRNHLKLRKQADWDNLMKTKPDLPELIKKYVSLSFLGRDKEGNEVFTVLAGCTDVKGLLHSLTLYEFLLAALRIIEHLMKEMEERHNTEGTRGMKFVVICDAKGLDLSRLMSRMIIRGLIHVIGLYEANYPEILKGAYVLNAPSLFYMAYNLVKGFFDERTLRKIHIYNGSAEKDLLEMIDADALPAFLGGRRTDPDGNPDCVSMFVRIPRIPKHLYLKYNSFERIREDRSYEKITIVQRSYHEHIVHVEDIGILIYWKFCTLDYNLKFGVYFMPDEVPENMDHPKKEWMIPLEFVECHVIPQEWQIYCAEPGRYVLHFDNTYSWMTPKKLYCKVCTRDPEKTHL